MLLLPPQDTAYFLPMQINNNNINDYNMLLSYDAMEI